MQQLQQQQQQLVAQMQMTQQALVLGGQSLEGKESNGRTRERHPSENLGSTGSSDGSLKENRPDNNNGDLLPPSFKVELNGGQ